MFKKSLVAAAVIMFAGVANAATDEGVAGGTITFNGSVTDTTCNVTTNNGSDFTVSLDPITLDSLGTTAGVVANGAKQFTMAVSGCAGSSTADDTLKITFSSSNVSDDQKYLTNYSGDAEGVGIALTTDGSAGTAVAFDSALDTGVTSTDAASTTGANVSFFANYYNYGGASVSTGSVVTTATYTFTYE